MPRFDRAIKLYSDLPTRPDIVAPTPRLNNHLLFHLEYYPYDPKSFLIEKAWKHYIFHPPCKKKLTPLRSAGGELIPLDQLHVAYAKPRKAGNLLSYRNLV